MEKLKTMFNFFSILTIMPLFNCNNNYTLKGRYLYKIYALTYFTLIFIIHLYCFCNLYVFGSLLTGIFKMTFVMEILIEIMEFVDTFIATIGSSFWHMQKWECFIKNYAKMENHFSIKIESYFFRNSKLLFILNALVFLILSIYSNCLWIAKIGFTVQSKYFLRYYKFLIKWIKFSLIFWQIYGIYFAYKKLNILLKKSNSGTIIVNLNIIESWHTKLRKLVQDMNKLFGMQILLGTIEISLCFINYVNLNRSWIQEKNVLLLEVSSTIIAMALLVRFCLNKNLSLI